MSKTIFEWIDDLTVNKTPTKEISKSEWKSFDPFMINLWLSMDVNSIEIVNYLQKYTLSGMKPEMVYRLLLSFLPKKKLYLKWIKGKKDVKYNKDLINYIKLYYEVSSHEAEEYLEIYYCSDKGKQEVETILKKYGCTDKEIKTMMKIIKPE
jgi:hypothetical protein